MEKTKAILQSRSLKDFQPISDKEDHLINEEICRLLPFGFNHGKLRKELLNSALKLISANAPSTIFRVCRSYDISGNVNSSEGFIDCHHSNLPSDQVYAESLKTQIEKHIHAVSSIAKADIYSLLLRTGTTDLRGLYAMINILNRNCMQIIADSKITLTNVNDIFFGWIRISLNEFWVIALRRFRNLPKFNAHDYAVLRIFLSRFYDFRNGWNRLDETRQYLKILTSREQEAIYHFVGGLKDKETAAQMNISKRTLDSHWQNIFNKIGVSDKILVLDKLGMITNKIPLENEVVLKQIKT